jgi:predicted metalloprotease
VDRRVRAAGKNLRVASHESVSRPSQHRLWQWQRSDGTVLLPWRSENIYLEHGDIEEAMRAANAIGDDAIQKKSQGRVVPHSFTHGTSEQRMRWFNKGLTSGRLEDGDTFSMPYRDL